MGAPPSLVVVVLFFLHVWLFDCGGSVETNVSSSLTHLFVYLQSHTIHPLTTRPLLDVSLIVITCNHCVYILVAVSLLAATHPMGDSLLTTLALSSSQFLVGYPFWLSYLQSFLLTCTMIVHN